MKSEIIFSDEKEETTYPCLMKSKSSGAIILFSNPRKGTVVGGCPYDIGFHDKDWADDNFEPFNGKVVLSND